MRLQLNGRFSAVGALALALAISVLISEIIACPEGYSNHRSHRMKRHDFSEIQCKGVYDRSIFARLDRVCEDCYNLYRDHHLHQLCRDNCFTTDYFVGCVEALQLSDEKEKYKEMIKQLHGADPRSQCFTTEYFKGCLESLLLKEEEEKFMQMVEFLGKRK